MQCWQLSLALMMLALTTAAGTAQTPKEAAPEQFYAEWISLKCEKSRFGFQTPDNMHEMHAVALFKVLKNNADGSTIYEQRLGRVQQRMLDSSWNYLIAKLEGGMLRVTVAADGAITAIEGLETMARKASGQESGLLFDNALRDLNIIARHITVNMLLPMRTPALTDGTRWTWRLGRLGSGYCVLDKTFTVNGRGDYDGRPIVKAAIQGKLSVVPYDPDDRQQPKDMRVDRQSFVGAAYLDEKSGRVLAHRVRGQLESTAQAPQAGGFIDSETTVLWEESLRISTTDPLAVQTADAAITQLKFTQDDRPKNATNSVGMKLVLIPAGKFRMGAPAKQPQRTEYETEHDVVLTRPFYMGAHEITIGQYRQFVEATGYRTDAERSGVGSFGWNKHSEKLEMVPHFTWKNRGWDITDAHPATNLSWYDARAYCSWLSAKEGKHYRLPTESEWEYACRAGTTTYYHSGDDPESVLKFGNIVDASCKKKFPQWQALEGDDGFVYSAPVGSYQPNAFGLYDMHGNALEWCEDWFWYYPTGVAVDPSGPPFGARKVQRGGSWADFPYQCTAARRTGITPTTYSLASGFRVVIGHEPAAAAPDTRWVGQRVIPRVVNMTMATAGPVPVTPSLHKPAIAFLVADERQGVLKTQLYGKDVLMRKSEVIPAPQAVAFFTEKLKADPQDADAYFLRASARLELGETAAGWADVNEGLRLRPTDAGGMWRRGDGFAAKREYRSAIADYTKAAELDPNLAGIHKDLAWLLATCPDAKLRDGAKALEHARKAQTLVVISDPLIAETLAAVYAETGDFTKAVQCQEEALADPQHAQSAGAAGRARLELYRSKQPYRQP